MGKELNKLVQARISQLMKEEEANFSVQSSEKEEILSRLQNDLIREVKKEVKGELLEDELVAMRERVQKEEVELKRVQLLDRVKGFLLEGIILAVLVGLLVNQLTDVVTSCKSIVAASGVATGFVVLLLIALLWLFIKLRLLDVIEKYEKQEDGQK